MVASISACKDPYYYLEVDHALYYLTGDTGAGVWHGEGARFLGFTGTVFGEQLIAAFNGLGSDDYTRHVRLPHTGRNRQPAWDITFSAPKSVSVLWSVLGADDRHKIESLVMQAAKRAIDYLDSRALLTRRGKGGETVEHAKGVYALCPHGTSRSQDPQLHIHSLAINMCVRQDGTTGGIRSKDLYIHKMAAGALFRLELASLLSKQLGLKVESDAWSFKLAGVPQSLCDEQSKRRQVIEQLAKEEGWHSPAVLAQLAIQTRAAKGLVSMAECTKEWLETGEKHSFGRQEAEQLLDAAQEAISTGLANRLRDDARDKLLREALKQGIESLSNSQSYFAERDLVQQVAASLQASGLTADEIVDAVEDSVDGFEHRIELHGSHYRYYATAATLAAERELLSIVENTKGVQSHDVSNEILEKAKKKVEKRLSEEIGVPAELTFDQHSALIHITQEPGRTKLVRGTAGTGKTQTLEAANLAWKQSGYQVLGTALTGKAAVGLQNATAIRSVTISKLLRSLRPELTSEELKQHFPQKFAAALRGAYFEGFRARAWMKNPLGQALKEMEQAYHERQVARPRYKLDAKTILVVDEAGMVPTKTMLALVQECDRVGTKLVLIGDSLQLPPIEAGGPFASLCGRIGCQYLTNIVRQRQEWMREASYAMVQNEPRHALDLYAANDCLRIEKSQRAAIARLVADYGKLSAAEYSSSLALTSTRADAAQINAGIQQRRLAARQLGGPSAVLGNGERVYENDRVMLTRNDYQLGVRNGLLGTVVSVLQPPWREGPARLEVKLDAQAPQGAFIKAGTLHIDLEKYSNVQLGYAATTHKAQGATVKSSYVLLGESMLNKEMAFTQLTRASHSTIIYAAEAELGNTLESLANRLSQSFAKDLANDHKIVTQSQSSIETRQALLQDTLSRLAPEKHKEAAAPTAYLADARLSSTQTGALWLLIGQYSKLRNVDYEKTIAVVTDTFEVGRINNSVQGHRKAAQQLGVDSLEIRQGERVHRGDRVLVTMNNEHGAPRTLLGTAVGIGFPDRVVMGPGRGQVITTQAKPWLTIELDSQHQTGQLAEAKERITVEGRDFDKLQLGYAATADKLKDIKVDSSLVLLPEQGHSPQDIAIQLTRATKDVSLFGEQSHYGPILDAEGGKGAFAKSLDSLKRDGPDAESTSLADRYRQILEEQRMQRAQSEQSQLSRQQSFEL
ncbi:MAG: relaxase domain-containing protein [Pirellulales bacterium]|nr:relaxase domain-containing protein [Pirellulales bacterium]